MNRAISLPFGTINVEIRLPERVEAQILSPRHGKALRDPQAEILSLLQGRGAAVDGAAPSLETLCRNAKRALIVISDRTRVTGVKVYLPVLIDFLTNCGLNQRATEILVATGMHSLAGQTALAEFVPKTVIERFSVSEHDCNLRNAHFHAGRTTRGTEVYLNNKVSEADLVVITGSIGLHYFAGFRGGLKSILPGIASFGTICSNHRLTISGDQGFHPLCKNGSLAGNPVHEDMLEVLPMIPHSFLLNTITDAWGNIVKVFTGDPIGAHLRGCESFKKDAVVEAPEKADCIIVSCGGYPRDATLIQAHKAMENVSPVLKEGGAMIVLAECRHGIGSNTFMSWFDGKSLPEVRRKLVTNYTLHGHTALSLLEKLNRFKIYLVSSLDDKTVASAGLIPARNVEEPLAEVADETKRGSELNLLVFPEGSETQPIVPGSH